MGSRYLARRIVQAILTIVGIVLLNFLLFRAMPGSPERVLMRNPNLSAEVLSAQRAKWGLDKPLIPDQLVTYVTSTLQLDFGESYKYRSQPALDVIAGRIWPTLILFGLGEAIAITVGLLLGAYTGWRRGGPVDYVGNGLSLVLYSMPYFLLGMILLVVFASNLGWFPSSGMFTLGATYDSWFDRLLDFGSHLFLPLAAVTLGLIGQYSILMRSSVMETRSEDYVQTARAKGIKDGRVLRRHAVPNALLPTISLIGINLGFIIAGAITVEVVFSWPGLGTLTQEALSSRDYPLLQGIFFILAVSVVFANLGADIIYGFLDPRVKS
ncbi:MAG TPA: ABC transporter permease [Candidatus Limnocylindrales bacterium]